MRSIDDVDWPVHSLMSFFHDLRGLSLRRLQPTVICRMTVGSASSRQIWPNHDSLTSGEDIDLLPYIFVCFMLPLWHAKHPPVALVLKGLDYPLQIRRQRPALTFIEQYWQDNWILEFNLCMASLLVLSWLSMLAPVWSLLPFFIDVPSLVCVVIGIWSGLLFPAFFIHPHVGRWSWFDAVTINFYLSKQISMP